MTVNDILLNSIDALWNAPEALLFGHTEDSDEPIDRDQAIDENGKAIYKSYVLSLYLGGEYFDARFVDIRFSAEDMEAYARTR